MAGLTAVPCWPEPFYSLRRFLLDTRGTVLHRVPLDLGFGCPHRGPGGSGGCSFCSGDGGRAPQIGTARGLEEQIARGVSFARGRYGDGPLMAYVQAHTGTFESPVRLRDLYARILRAYPFRALSIATRPDCLGPEIVAVLAEFRSSVDLWVEIGVQTAHDETLRRVRRGHDWESSCRAAERLGAAGVTSVAHLILGLPGETTEHWRATARKVACLPLAGVKIHNLHVLRGTPLAEEFARDPFPVYDAAQYGEILMDFLRRIPSRWAVLRICTDSPASERVAPQWNMDKTAFRDFVVLEMRRRNWTQGDLCASGDAVSRAGP
jgi:radical SAM protein (TIGR01212 family)